MTLGMNLLVGIREIWSHKFRSILTMLGVILGVAALLSTFALTEGIAQKSQEYMAQIGGIERVTVVNQEVPQEQLLIADISPGRTWKDAEAIRRCSLVEAVTPVYEIPVTFSRAGSYQRGVANGCWPDFVPINAHVVEHGRNISQIDLDEARRVCVIGTRMVEELWPGKKHVIPLGETIMVMGRPFVIVGVLERYEREEDKRRRRLGIAPRMTKSGRTSDPYRTKNSTVIIPFTTAFYEFKSAFVPGTGNDPKPGRVGSATSEDQGPQHRLEDLVFRVKDVKRLSEAVDQVGAIMKSTHRGVEDFSFVTREEYADRIEENTRTIRMNGLLIASIALLVGGIGITNIMLASITERIREIGVRRAVGAKRLQIFTQIVVESGTIGFFGGLLGLVASFGVMEILKMINPTENSLVVDPSAVLISFTFAVVIGLLSGLYPAWRASHIEPIEALRYG